MERRILIIFSPLNIYLHRPVRRPAVAPLPHPAAARRRQLCGRRHPQQRHPPAGRPVGVSGAVPPGGAPGLEALLMSETKRTHSHFACEKTVIFVCSSAEEIPAYCAMIIKKPAMYKKKLKRGLQWRSFLFGRRLEKKLSNAIFATFTETFAPISLGCVFYAYDKSQKLNRHPLL